MGVVLVRREKGEVGELVARRLKLDDMDCMDTMDDMDIQIKSHYSHNSYSPGKICVNLRAFQKPA
jgi:hypothetical protein